MTNVPNANSSYRDILTYYFDSEIGSVVGCGLDRAGGHYNSDAQNKAIEYYEKNKADLLKLPIGSRREAIANFITNGY